MRPNLVSNTIIAYVHFKFQTVSYPSPPPALHFTLSTSKPPRLNVALRCVTTCRAIDLLVHRNSDLVDVVVKRSFIPGRRGGVHSIDRACETGGGGLSIMRGRIRRPKDLYTLC